MSAPCREGDTCATRVAQHICNLPYCSTSQALPRRALLKPQHGRSWGADPLVRPHCISSSGCVPWAPAAALASKAPRPVPGCSRLSCQHGWCVAGRAPAPGHTQGRPCRAATAPAAAGGSTGCLPLMRRPCCRPACPAHARPNPVAAAWPTAPPEHSRRRCLSAASAAARTGPAG